MRRSKKNFQACLFGVCVFWILALALAISATIMQGDMGVPEKIKSIGILAVPFAACALFASKLKYCLHLKRPAQCEARQQDESTIAPPDTIFIRTGRTIIRADGRPLTDEDTNYLREASFERAEENYKNNLNPKFNRSEAEERLSMNFCSKYAEEIQRVEGVVSDERIAATKGDIDSRMQHLQNAILLLEGFEKMCHRTQGGRLYFEDEWLHCHNSKNSDFSTLEEMRQKYLDYSDNYEARKHQIAVQQKRDDFLANGEAEILQTIIENQDILQKDIYHFFDVDLKSTISVILKRLEGRGIIERIKRGNTYVLKVKK